MALTLTQWPRMWRHLMADRTVRHALPPAAQQRIAAHVAASERQHRGQVRVVVEAGLPWSYLWRQASARERALSLFGKQRVWDTEHNNGVLIYLLLADHAVEVVADRGIDRRVAADHWRATVQHLCERLRAGDTESAILTAIDEVTAPLVQHFPATPGEAAPNELPDAPLLR